MTYPGGSQTNPEIEVAGREETEIDHSHYRSVRSEQLASRENRDGAEHDDGGSVGLAWTKGVTLLVLSPASLESQAKHVFFSVNRDEVGKSPTLEPTSAALYRQETKAFLDGANEAEGYAAKPSQRMKAQDKREGKGDEGSSRQTRV
jgi:hypothetical protein